MTKPTLSLLIPAYNAEKFLPRLLASARAQTEPFDEIWVYDDCSTDQTAAVAQAWGARVIRGERNKGCSAGKNALAARVNTDWLHFHDADDALLPHFGALARKWINANKHDVVLFAYECRDDQTDEHLGLVKFDRTALEHDARAYAIRTQINPFCGLYRRQSFLDAGGYDEDPVVLYNEDCAFHIRLAFAGLRFSADDEVSIINYRVANSMSAANAKRCAVAQYHVLRRTHARTDAQPYSRPIAEKLWKLSGVLGSFDAWPEAAEAAQLAAKLHPPGAGSGAPWFRALANVNPVLALRLREAAIRKLKPGLRTGSAGS
jgi:glycosyltransferase involved in cell wall biosynthesis